MLELGARLVWGPWTLGLFLLVGGYYSLGTGFFQLFGARQWLGAALRALFHRDCQGGLSPLQTLSTALAATIGTGSIVGVATAITLGGPGAVFWMWVAALLGMITSFAEKALAVACRRRGADGQWQGGPMVWLEQLGLPRLGKLYAFCCILVSLGMCGLAQANSLSAGLNQAFGLPPLGVGLGAAALVALSLMGGIGRIGRVCEKLVPAMTVLFFLGGLWVLFRCRAQVPQALGLIFQDAFGLAPLAGGGAGAAIRYGMARGVFNTEAGLGTTALIHSHSAGRDPVEEGLWGIFEVFLDGIVLCGLMALIILSSGAWTPGGPEGAALCAAAFAAVMGPWGPPFVGICLALFAFTALLSGSCYGQRGVEHLWKGRGERLYLLLFLGCVVVGSVGELEAVWLFSDLCNGLMAIPCLIALLLLSPQVLQLLRDKKR